MINLLPDAHKKEFRAARANVILLRYNFVLLGTAVFLLLAGLVVYVVLNNSKAIAESTNSSNSQRASEFEPTRKATDEYRKNLEIAKKILNNEVVYTDLAFAITNLLPKGVLLDGLELDSQKFGAPTLLNAHAKDYAAVSELKRVFESSALFSNVHFQTITANDNSSPGYPISVIINVTMDKATKQ